VNSSDERPQRAVIFAQKIEHFLGLGGQTSFLRFS
jgi:hypothetical protein